MKTLLSIFILLQLTFLHADNYSLSFDGSDDYVSISNSDNFDIVDELTITAWVQPSQIKDASTIDRLVDSGNEDTGEGGYRLNIRGDGEINLSSNKPSLFYIVFYV